MIRGADVILNKDYIKNRDELNALADKIKYTGPINEFFNYKFGDLEYRSLKFETF